MSTSRPKGDPRFHAELKVMGDTHDAKQEGYGTSDDPFANYHKAAELGVEPWKYVVLRINERMARLASAMRGPSPVDVNEELTDIAVMSVIAKVLYNEDNPGQKPGEVIYLPEGVPVDRWDPYDARS